MVFAILRAEKLKTMGNIGGSLAHNYRSIETPNADPSKRHLVIFTAYRMPKM